MKKLIIVAPLSSLSKRTRLYKLSKFCQKNFSNIAITHIGWERASGESREQYLDMITKKIILSGGGYGGKLVKVMYFIWMLKVFFSALFFKKNDIVWALGLESAFPVMLASKVKKFEVIFDDADRFSMIFPLPRLLKKYIEYLEEYTSNNVRHHVVPGMARYDFESSKFHVLRNMPSKDEIGAARALYETSSWGNAELVLYVNGWLGDGRGMRQALYLAEQLRGESFKIILAGKLDCEAAVDLSKKDNVLYLGDVSNTEALAAYFASNFVFTYYDPSIHINNYAESNKWGDALKTETAVIVNSEVKTANFLHDLGAALSFEYADKEGLLASMRRCISDSSYKNSFSCSSSITESYPYFEEQLDKILGDSLCQ